MIEIKHAFILLAVWFIVAATLGGLLLNAYGKLDNCVIIGK